MLGREYKTMGIKYKPDKLVVAVESRIHLRFLSHAAFQ